MKYIEVQNIDPEESTADLKLDIEQAKIGDYYKKIRRNTIIKVVSTIVAAVVTWFLADLTIVRLINFLFYSNSSSTVLKTAIDGWVPQDLSVKNILT